MLAYAYEVAKAIIFDYWLAIIILAVLLALPTRDNDKDFNPDK